MKQTHDDKARSHMPLKMLIAVLTGMLALTAGCAAQQGSGAPSGSDSSLRPVIYPSKDDFEYSEEQVIKKQLQVTTQWQTVTFEKPLQIKRRGLMGLHLAVDYATYNSTMNDYLPIDPECIEPECAIRTACLRRRSDGVIVRLEAVLKGDNGVEVRVMPGAHLFPYSDQHVMTVGLYAYKDVKALAPFPRGIEAFTSMRIRSNEPFLVRYMLWTVDAYPRFIEQ